jgi:hypothetical protein
MMARKASTKRQPVAEEVILQPGTFAPYVEHLATLFSATARDGADARKAELTSALDGQPGRQLRKLYTIDALRDTGTYFTGSALANRLVTALVGVLPGAERVVDPACGAGDLLVACARHLPLKADLSETLKDWGERLTGFDINSAFVEATRYRLALLALQRMQTSPREIPNALPVEKAFSNIQSRSGLAAWQIRDSPAVIVVNPPFTYGVAEKNCTWANGRISQAATFINTCLSNAARGTRILAILPDVLRTGSRYEKWRQMITAKATVHSVEIIGQFDELTEISVFLLELEVGEGTGTNTAWAHPKNPSGRTVNDFFDVHVGPVVPFRLDRKGRWCTYVRSEQLPPWETVRKFDQRIRFKGTTYNPPFVAIRRTSKADYQVRCIGTLVTGDKPIAVENHLLIAMPRDKRVSTCKQLLDVLKREFTSIWMNERIRCRHLTVGSVGELPWAEGEAHA